MNTVNVIEYSGGTILGLYAFPDTVEGNKDAEARFICMASENGAGDDSNLSACIEDGIWEQGDYQIFLTHSS